MHLFNKQIKRGQTLIEVVVSLTILIFVFMGTITLIINTVNLTLSSRDKTEAMALAQKSLTEAKVYLSGGCNASNDSPDFTLLGYTNNGSEFYKRVDDSKDVYLRYVKTDNIDNNALEGIDFSSSAFNPIDFGVLEVRITWVQKGMPDGEIINRQIVRK